MAPRRTVSTLETSQSLSYMLLLICLYSITLSSRPSWNTSRDQSAHEDMQEFGAERVVLGYAAMRKTSCIASIIKFHYTDNVVMNSTNLQLMAELPEDSEDTLNQ